MNKKLTFIKKSWTEQTGGGVMVDYIRLKNGELIGITDECIVNYGKVADAWDAEEASILDDRNIIDLI